MNKRAVFSGLVIASSLVALSEVSRFAFSKNVARDIYWMYDGECQDTGVRAGDGYRLDIAHYPPNHFDRWSPDVRVRHRYNEAKSGRPLWIPSHLTEHIGITVREIWPNRPRILYGHDTQQWAEESLKLIATRAWLEGYMKTDFYREHPATFEDHREHLVSTFEEYDLDAFDYIAASAIERPNPYIDNWKETV